MKPYEGSRLYSPPNGPSRMHMVYCWHYPTSLPGNTKTLFPRVYEPLTPI